AQAQQLAAAQPGANLGDEVVAVERPADGEEPAELLGGKGALVAEDLLGGDARLWRLHVAARVGGDQPLGAAASRMRSRIERYAITPLWPSLPSSSCCQRSTIDGV